MHQNIFSKVQAQISFYSFSSTWKTSPTISISECAEATILYNTSQPFAFSSNMSSRATNEAVTALASLRSTTMTPFLYQTRSLSNFAWAGKSLPHGPRYLNQPMRNDVRCLAQQFIHRRQYSDSTQWGRTVETKPRRTETRVKRNVQTRDTTPRRSAEKKPRKDKRNAEFEIPFEFDQIPKSRVGNTGGSASNRWDSVPVNEFGEADDGEFGEADGAGFEGEDGESYEDEGEERASMNLRGPRESTITEGERRAFQRIFTDMFAQNSSSAEAPPPGDQVQAKTRLNSIMGDALGRMPPDPRTQEEKERIVSSYPQALQSAAAKAMRLGQGDEEDPFDGEMEELRDIDQEQLQAVREPEVERVETLMKEAKTDIELWEVMEKEVFSLIPKLGLDEAPLNVGQIRDGDIEGKAKTGKNVPKMKKAKKAKIVSEKENSDKHERYAKIVAQTPNGTEVSALTLYGPLYPSYLLLGLRLLDRSFYKPSPLALSILPKIKSLGAISHVLGASTQFYNEILRTYYYRYEDFGGVAKTLNEMDHSAVDQDEETLDIVIDILRMQAGVSRGERGELMKVLWSQPQYSRVKFQFWRNKIADILTAKGQANRFSRQDYTPMRNDR